MAAAERIRDLRTAAAGRLDQEDEELLGLHLVENVLWGYDVNLTATHMAASTLGMLSPTTRFQRVNVQSRRILTLADASRVPGEISMSNRGGRSKGRNLRPSIRPRERTPDATIIREKQHQEEQAPHWEVSRVAGSPELKLTAECIADIAECLIRINELASPGRFSASTFRRQVRYLSIPVRKLILGSEELLLRRCFVPRLHPLKTPRDDEPDVLSEWMGGLEFGFTVGDSTEERRASFPTDHTHETVVKPLHGLKKIREKQYLLMDPFDWSSTPVKDSRWLNSKVLQVDDTVLSVEDLLRMMVNREGAHSDRDELTLLNLSGPVKISLADAGDEAYRRANTINLSRLSYVQIFTYLVGIYLVNMMKASLRYIPAEVARNGAAPDTWRTIISAPAEPLRQPLELGKDFGMQAVFQSTDDPDHSFVLVGDYEANSTTTIQIPGWE